MSDEPQSRPAKPKREPPRRTTVQKVAKVTPGLIRVTFEGPELATFGPPRPAAHIKLFFPAPGASWDPLDEKQPRPPSRTYTPRTFDAATQRLDVDFVLHGSGLASDWAMQAKPGQAMFIGGPGGGYEIPADARTLVVAADDTALPAVGMILEALPVGVTPLILAEISGPLEERELSDRIAATPRWLHRDTASAKPSELLETAVLDLPLPADAAWWVACEAAAMRRIKQYLLKDRVIDPGRVHVRGYWKLGETAYPDHDYGKD